MKLSLFTTITNPQERGDNYNDAVRCYKELADEVVIVNGGQQITQHLDIKYVNRKWPQEFDWAFIGQQFQRGYEACTGDWVIRMDIDTIFHETDFDKIRQALNYCDGMPAVALHKRQFILPDRYNVKSRIVVAVNKDRFGKQITFDGGGDLCQPAFNGDYLKPDEMPNIRIPLWNYECLLKTNAQLLEDKGRFARAWQRQFGEYKLGGPDEQSAYDKWLEMMAGRFNKPQEKIPLKAHPRYVQDTIKNLKPEQWGFDGLGHLERNSYAQDIIGR